MPSNVGEGEATDEQPSAIVNGHDVSIRPLCLELVARVNAFLESKAETPELKAVQEQTRVSLGVISQALDRYRHGTLTCFLTRYCAPGKSHADQSLIYSLEEISLSYNGGKDCLVLLILFLCALSKQASPLPSSLQSVYIISPHPFAEVDSFVNECVSTYQLDLARYNLPMKASIKKYLEDRPSVKAIFVGTRRTDPHGALLTHFDPTDHGWPSFMRVHPVIDWHYVEIWTFIRHLKIPYCSLYDLGYTSLGGTTDTHPNPTLIADEEVGGNTKTFRPAYELVKDEAERLGRDR